MPGASVIKAIVTGHSKGLGAALAAELLARGIDVLGLARGSASVLAARHPQRLSEHLIDLADAAQLAQWLAGPALGAFVGRARQVVLINNAGVVSPVGSLQQQDVQAIMRAVSLNVAAPMMLAAAVVAAAPGAERRILHVSSGAGRSAYPGWSVYCATKAALDQHARAVALDGEPGVRICSLAPGVIDTGMQAEIRNTPESRFRMRQRFVDLKRDGELAAPADCASRLVDYVLAARFGERPVDGLRD